MRARRFSSGYMATGLVVGTAAVTFLGAFLLGSLILPAAEAVPRAGESLPSVDALTGSQAILVVYGELEHVQVLDSLSVDDYNEETTDDDPIDIDLTFRAGGSTLLIRAEQLLVETPAPASRVIVSLGANTFRADPGECTVELLSIDYVVLRPAPIVVGPPRGRPIPAYTGSLTCPQLHETQTNAVVTVEAIFQYRPEESPLS